MQHDIQRSGLTGHHLHQDFLGSKTHISHFQSISSRIQIRQRIIPVHIADSTFLQAGNPNGSPRQSMLGFIHDTAPDRSQVGRNIFSHFFCLQAARHQQVGAETKEKFQQFCHCFIRFEFFLSTKGASDPKRPLPLNNIPTN